MWLRRPLIPLSGLLLAGSLGACASHAYGPTMPPSVAYRVEGTDIAQANATASDFCRRNGGSGAQLESLINGVATYDCGRPVSTAAVPGPATAPQD